MHKKRLKINKNNPIYTLFFYFEPLADWAHRGQVHGYREAFLLLVVALAVRLCVSEVAGVGERLLARSALKALLVPGRAIDPHQETV